MMRRRTFAGTVVVIVFYLAMVGCSHTGGDVLVPDNFEELKAKYPVLSSIPFVLVTTEEYVARIERGAIPRLDITECGPFDAAPLDAVCVGSETLVPVVPLRSLIAGLSLEDAQAYFRGKALPNGIMIMPLSKVELPLKAIPVDGKHINDNEYPLVKRMFVSVALTSPELGYDSKSKGLEERIKGSMNKHSELELLEAVRSWLYKAARAEEKLYQDGEELTWIVAVGDVMLSRGIDELLRTENGVEKVFSSTLQHLQQGAITACNFEAVLSQGVGPTKKSYNFYVPPWVLPYIQKAGFKYLTITNNHIWDYGPEGFIDTLEALEKSPFAFSGAGRNLEQASVPWTTSIGTTTYKVLSVAAYPKEKNGFDGKMAAAAETDKPGILFSGKGAEEAMRHYFSPDSFDIVFVHGGIELQTYPGKEYENLYRSFVDAGADLVIGSHPHVLQKMEAYKGRLIAYSLGDFVFAGMNDIPGGEDAVILKVGISGGRIIYVEAVPVKLSNTGVMVKKGSEGLSDFLSLP